MSAEKSHRFALTGQDPEGGNRTIILWQEAELVEGSAPRGAGLGTETLTIKD